MTPKERAWALQTEMAELGNESVYGFIVRVEQVLTEAIEEEREACAALIDKQAQGMDVLIAHAPTALRAEDMKRLRHSLNVVAACVRTRE